MPPASLFALCRGLRKGSQFDRLMTSGVLRNELLEDDFSCKNAEDDLKSRILRLRLPKRSATVVLEKWVGEGNSVTALELRHIAKELRKSQRFKHALEISEWMATHEDFKLSDSDYATRIDLMTKVFGIDAAERYFEDLPEAAKTSETYTALLHCYAAKKLVDKAEELYGRMKLSNLYFTALTYNELMTLYVSVSQVEKVPLVIEELKRQKVTPDIYTYNLWISSCAATLNIDEVKRILVEMSHDTGCNDDWARYIRVANIYITASQLVHADSAAVVEAEKNITQRELITYDFLIILYAGMGSRDKVYRIWNSLRMTKQKMTNRNYICILSSYLMLGHFKDVGEVIDQWKQSTGAEFDISACKSLLDALSGMGLTETSNNFHMILTERNCDPSIFSQ